MDKNILGYEKTSVLLRKFAVPSIVAMLVSSLYNIVDQIFIGQGVGYLGNAATNVAFPLTTICLAISLLIGVGCAAGFSLELGAGNKDKAEHYVKNALGMALIFGLLYLIVILVFLRPMLKVFGATGDIIEYAVDYTRITAFGMPVLVATNVLSNLIRADGGPSYSMICMIVGAVINTLLDPLFIFVFKLGMAGAAWATIIGQYFSFFAALMYLKKFKSIKLSGKLLEFKIKTWLKIASLGMSNNLNQVAITIVQIVLNNSLTYYGALSVYGSEIPLAGCGIVMKVNSILISVFVGLAQGSQPIIGFNYGAKKYDRVKDTYKKAILTSICIGFIGFLLFQIIPETIVALFGKGDALYIEFSVKFMKIFLFMIAFTGVQIISSNFFSAIGKPLKGVFLSLTRQVIFLIPLLLILPLLFGIDGVMFSGPVSDSIAATICFVMVMIEFKKMNK
ncbi:MAG: MATE family efflux transporter [Clostridia bacterium]|nr:MATE family efflux transporter [Clostridia bacterium]